MSDIPVFDDKFVEQLRVANLVLDTTSRRAQSRTELWKVAFAAAGAGAALFAAGGAFVKLVGG